MCCLPPQPVRVDVERMCLNAVTFNTTGDKVWKEAFRFFHAATATIEAYAQATHPSAHAAELVESETRQRDKEQMIKHAKVRQGSAVRPLPCTDPALTAPQIQQMMRICRPRRARPQPPNHINHHQSATHNHRVAAPWRPRCQHTRSREVALGTKDAVAGNAVLQWKLPPLVAPRDPLPCIECAELSPGDHEAYSCAWLDLCFVCGSAGLDGCDDIINERDGGPFVGGRGGGGGGSAGGALAVLSSPPATGGGEAAVAPELAPVAAREPRGKGREGSRVLFLFCADCGEAFHWHCVSAPIEAMDARARATWRCPNCKVCEICGSCTASEEGDLIFCELCDKG